MSQNKKRCTAIVLAAGSGSRMQSREAKQFMLLDGKPLIWYSLQAMERSAVIDDCIVVTGEKDIPYVRQEIVEKYHFTKVEAVVAGGTERYFSVLNGLRAIVEGKLSIANEDGLVFIHDGARPFLTESILEDTCRAAEKYHACVAAVPSKDTIKIADGDGFVENTPSRKQVWSIQTPQVFDVQLIVDAYEALATSLPELQEKGVEITDDAGVVEKFTGCKVKLVEASYTNLKITTPEDMQIATTILENYCTKCNI